MKRKIVLLNEDPHYRSGMSKALRGDRDVVSFGSCSHFLRYVCDEPDSIDVVCVDIGSVTPEDQLWPPSGIEVIQTLRNTLKDRAPVICVLSSLTGIQDVAHSLSNGADGFVPKTDDLEQTAQAILTHAQRRAH